ncbi:MAG: non-canonical purine NTP pyrophosphatase [Pirellulales bacterium]
MQPVITNGPSHHRLVLGTGNRKKARELAGLLAHLGLQLPTLSDFDDPREVIEDGTSFGENARKKAIEQALHLRAWVLGEDSGLAVDQLDGAPGIYSARFAGPQASDEENNRHLLDSLGATPLAARTARYVCHMAISDPAGNVRAESEASCQGRIRMAPAGTNGFGYDPLFEIVEYHRTFGQLGPVVKRLLSHRARATRLLLPKLEPLVQRGQWRTDDHPPGKSLVRDAR